MQAHSRFVVLMVAIVAAISIVAARPSATSGSGSGATQFTLKAIPASAVHHPGQVPHIRNRNGTSTNWSGYAVYGVPTTSRNGKTGATPTFSNAAGSWVVPDVAQSASASTWSSTWVGIDGYTTSTVEQIGTEQDWSNGGASYYAWFEMYPKWGYQILGFPVNPGDTISAAVDYVSKGTFKLTITNATRNVTFSTTQRTTSAQRLSAEWVVEAPWSGGVLPLADFGTVGLFDCTATMNGHLGVIGDTQWQRDAITMQASDGTDKAVPSGLTADGAGFSVDWKHE